MAQTKGVSWGPLWCLGEGKIFYNAWPFLLDHKQGLPFGQFDGHISLILVVFQNPCLSMNDLAKKAAVSQIVDASQKAIFGEQLLKVSLKISKLLVKK